MDERLKFVGRLLSGEKMAPLCREFGISRVTGHKLWKRYQDQGSFGLQYRSRAPHSHPNQTPFDVELQYARAWVWNLRPEDKAKPHFPDLTDILQVIRDRRIKFRNTAQVEEHKPFEAFSPEERSQAIASLKELRQRQLELVRRAANDESRRCHETVLRIITANLERHLAIELGQGKAERATNAQPTRFDKAIG